jgi:hypothetical protein
MSLPVQLEWLAQLSETLVIAASALGSAHRGGGGAKLTVLGKPVFQPPKDSRESIAARPYSS